MKQKHVGHKPEIAELWWESLAAILTLYIYWFITLNLHICLYSEYVNSMDGFCKFVDENNSYYEAKIYIAWPLKDLTCLCDCAFSVWW